MLSAHDLKKHYRIGDDVIHAVRGVDFEVERGEFLTIIGHSGSGKSTLLSMVGALTRPSEGSVMLEQVDLWKTRDAQRSRVLNTTIGFIFQFASLIPTLTALDNVVLPRMFSSKGARREAQYAAEDLLEKVGLEDKMDCFPSELSGGQQRRVSIARALVNQPKIILADEPTGDLDEETEAQVLDLLVSIKEEFHVALVAVTHNHAVADRADRIFRMKDGRFV